MEIVTKAHAKINITLDVLGRRPDGYHDVRMIMQTISLSDTITIRTEAEKGVRVASNLPYLPTDRRNIAREAAERFLEEAGLLDTGVFIGLNKRIPVAAGLAGGSSNAAAVLNGLNALFGQPLPRETLFDIAARIGADVAYCLVGGTVLAEGIGERLTRLPEMAPCHVVLSKPPHSISTKAIYKQLQCSKIQHRPDTEGVMAALAAGDLRGVARRLYNVLEPVALKRSRDIAYIKGELISMGALGAVMSGSGPTVFGLFEDEGKARTAEERLRREYKDTYLAEICGAPEQRNNAKIV